MIRRRREDDTLVRPLLNREQQREAARAEARWRRERQAWQDEHVSQTTDPALAGEDRFTALRARLRGTGPDGVHAGRVLHRMRLPAHLETTAQAQGVYPFLASAPLPAAGAYIGSNAFTRGAFCFDPFELYRRRLLSNPNILLAGVIGTGKSSLLKCLILRLGVFGHKFFVPADTKGEMVAMAQALGVAPIRLGPGFEALNPLYAPPKPITMGDQEYADRVESHRLLLLSSLGETAQGRPLTAREDLMLELAVRDVTGQLTGTDADRLRQLTFPRLVHAMLHPTDQMMRTVTEEVGADATRWRAETEELAMRFRSMVSGSLKGVFDGDEVSVDLDKPGVVIDISRIRASDAAVALTMTCGQALGDLILTFSKSQWLKVLDECWRQVRYPAILRRISEGQKLARGDDQTTGSATIMALHRISDLMGASPEVRELAMGLLADTSTRIVYGQASDQLAATQAALSLTDRETAMLPGFGQGEGLWKIGAHHSAVVHHQILRGGLEWPLIETDSRMRADGEAQYRQLEDPAGAMAAEIDAGAA